MFWGWMTAAIPGPHTESDSGTGDGSALTESPGWDFASCHTGCPRRQPYGSRDGGTRTFREIA